MYKKDQVRSKIHTQVSSLSALKVDDRKLKGRRKYDRKNYKLLKKVIKSAIKKKNKSTDID